MGQVGLDLDVPPLQYIPLTSLLVVISVKFTSSSPSDAAHI